jgi:hypothetical protein
MWALALREKAQRRFGADAARRLLAGTDGRLVAAWDHLSPANRDRVVQLAESLAKFDQRKRGGHREESVTLIIVDR